MTNKIAKNIKSPKNEAVLIERYKQANPRAKKPDNLDIAAVKTKSGEIGHGLMNPGFNRSKDKGYHVVKDFIPDKELKSKTHKK